MLEGVLTVEVLLPVRYKRTKTVDVILEDRVIVPQNLGIIAFDGVHPKNISVLKALFSRHKPT